MKLAIALVGGNLTSSKYSHKAGWAHLWACQLKNTTGWDVEVLTDNQDWDDYDVVYLYHDMAFQGALNLFGGASEESAKYYERLATKKCRMISLDIPMPDYGELCKGRLKSCDEYWKNVDWDKVSEACKGIHHIQQSDLMLQGKSLSIDSLIVGDSHAFSVYDGKSAVIRKDGRTLNGVLKKSIKKEITDNGFDLSHIKHVTAYYGNIDIRHHVMRSPKVLDYVFDLISRYEQNLKDLGTDITVVLPLPIEDESRRLPKTGYYEGTPFYGTLEQRQNLVKLFSLELKKMCTKNGWKVYEWPKEWYNITPLEYMKNYMERPKSVHCAPLYHRWDYWENKFNDRLNNVLNTRTTSTSLFD